MFGGGGSSLAGAGVSAFRTRSVGCGVQGGKSRPGEPMTGCTMRVQETLDRVRDSDQLDSAVGNSNGDWRNACVDIVGKDKAAIQQLSFRGCIDIQDAASSRAIGGGRLDLASGRQYPNRGRHSELAKPPPKIPTPRNHESVQFAARCRAARRELGLPTASVPPSAGGTFRGPAACRNATAAAGTPRTLSASREEGAAW
eukprot:TRINITY_DN16754_c0_g1_i1.p1 TRINITY_DN16754_c0_g1~~TRINITY_DN16754_c0_g1_i1.p1  ORF type:complete len:199 (+),score=21.04 TRINITY_DN16754_c0_g1_i1:69-665(+)